MKNLFRICISIYICFLLLSISFNYISAEEINRDRPDENRPEYYRDHKGPPPDEMLSAAEYSIYSRSLETGDCDQAYALLTNAYVRMYPEQPHPGTSVDTSVDWKFNVADEHYPELVFCLALRGIDEKWAEIVRRGIAYERYSTRSWQNTETWFELAVGLDISISRLIELARREYPDAYLALVRLSDEGEILRYTKEFHYYQVLRARDLGIDSPELDGLTQRAEDALDPDIREALRKQAKQKWFAFPGSKFE